MQGYQENKNKKEPNSGFVRIWDFSPRVITDTMKEELYQVAIYGLKKEKNVSASN